jgi:hypothetical protein
MLVYKKSLFLSRRNNQKHYQIYCLKCSYDYFVASTSSQEALETNEPLPSTTTALSNDEQSSSNANDEFGKFE